jgi:hypothetical protein
MSIQLIQRYYAEVDKIIRYGGSWNESSLRKPFQHLLEQYARARNLVRVAEIEMESRRGTWLVDVQAHTLFVETETRNFTFGAVSDPTLFKSERGQLPLLRMPGS